MNGEFRGWLWGRAIKKRRLGQRRERKSRKTEGIWRPRIEYVQCKYSLGKNSQRIFFLNKLLIEVQCMVPLLSWQHVWSAIKCTWYNNSIWSSTMFAQLFRETQDREEHARPIRFYEAPQSFTCIEAWVPPHPPGVCLIAGDEAMVRGVRL